MILPRALSTVLRAETFILMTMAAASLAEEQSPTVIDEGPIGQAVTELFSPYGATGGPGGIVAVLRHGETVHLQGFGYADREHRRPWTAHTPYTFYSVTKPMLAIAFLRLADAGQVDLDAPVRQYLDEFPRFPQEPTVRHLLQHTSGIWLDERMHYLLGVGASNEEITLDELYRMALEQPELSFGPGSTQYYNDAGMRIAARVLERVTGKSFDQAMRELLLAPAGMHTAFHRPRSTAYVPGQAKTYLLSQTPNAAVDVDELITPHLAVETAGDGGLAGSLLDLVAFARFASAKRDGGSYVERLAAPVRYASGISGSYRTSWAVSSHRGLEVHSHGGLFGKKIVYVPDLDMWILIMVNAVGGHHGTRESWTVILDAALRQDSRFADRFSRDAEARYGAGGRPPRQSFTVKERRLLLGTFVEPRSGGVLRIYEDGEHLTQEYLAGERGYVVREPGGFRSWRYSQGAEPVRLRLEGDNLLANVSDWGEYRALERVDPRALPEQPWWDEIAGTYVSPAYGSVYHLAPSTTHGAVLRVNAGIRDSDRYRLQPIAPGVYEAVQLGDGRVTFRFLVSAIGGGGDAISGLRVDYQGIRGFRLARWVAASTQP